MFYFDQCKWCIYYDNTNWSNIEGRNVPLWVNLIGNKYEFRKLNVMFYFSTLWQALHTHSSGLFLNCFYLPAWVLCCCSSVFLRALDGSPSWPLSFQPHTYRSPPSGDQTVWVISPSSSCRQHATTQLPVSCLVWKSLAANADRVPASCCHAAHGHPPEGLHSPGLLLGGEASMTQLTMTGGDQHSENMTTQLGSPSWTVFVFVQPTCPVPRCTPLQRHWAARRARHSVQDSWLSDVAIRSDIRVVLWLCNLQGPGADSRGGLEVESMLSHIYFVKHQSTFVIIFK